MLQNQLLQVVKRLFVDSLKKENFNKGTKKSYKDITDGYRENSLYFWFP